MKETFTQIQPKAGETVRISLLTSVIKPKACYYHWLSTGGYRCNTKDDVPHECCAKYDRSWTCWCLALKYLDADPTGKLAHGVDSRYLIGYLALRSDAFREVNEYLVSDCDLYFKNDHGYHFTGASSNPRWKDFPKRGKVIADAAAMEERFLGKIYPKLTDAEWHNLITTGSRFGVDEE